MREINLTKANKLLKQINDKIVVIELGVVRFKGFSNVTRSDMDLLRMKLENAIRLGYWDPSIYGYPEEMDAIIESICK